MLCLFYRYFNGMCHTVELSSNLKTDQKTLGLTDLILKNWCHAAFTLREDALWMPFSKEWEWVVFTTGSCARDLGCVMDLASSCYISLANTLHTACPKMRKEKNLRLDRSNNDTDVAPCIQFVPIQITLEISMEYTVISSAPTIQET